MGTDFSARNRGVTIGGKLTNKKKPRAVIVPRRRMNGYGYYIRRAGEARVEGKKILCTRRARDVLFRIIINRVRAQYGIRACVRAYVQYKKKKYHISARRLFSGFVSAQQCGNGGHVSFTTHVS